MDEKVEKLEAQIAEIKKRRDATQDSKVRKRLNSQAKQKQRQLDDYNQRPSNMRTGIDPKAGSRKRIPTQRDIELHHVGTSLNNARAFFEGLDTAEKLLMEKRFAELGMVPGDVTMNALAMTKTDHRESPTAIHNIERDLKLEGKQYFKPGATFEEKLKAVDAFAADQRTLRKLAEEKSFSSIEETGGLTRRVEATATPEQSQKYQDVEQKRRTETARDIREYGPKTHQVAGTQTEPGVDFNILRHYRSGAQTPPTTVKPKAKPTNPKASATLNAIRARNQRFIMYGGQSDFLPEIQDDFSESDGLGTPLGGARTVEMGDYSFGTV